MDLVGRTVGNYVIVRKVGEGGMGTVYLAEHPRISRRVAIKVLHPETQRSPGVVARFLTEAQASSEIRSEHVIEILDFGELQPGEPYLTMEWLEGSSLAERLRQDGRFPFARALHVLEGAGRGLSAAHAKGVIHRDLKPDNVFLVDRNGDSDFVKVLDFGIAKVLSREGESANFRTQTGAILGTPAYMSPEQANGAAGVDHRSDIYSLGVMAYELVTGRVPFRREGWGDMLLAHKTEVPVPPIEVEPTLGRDANRAILRALAKAPEKRFQSVEELLLGLTGKVPEPALVVGKATNMMAPTEEMMPAPPPVQPSQSPTTLRGASGELTVPPATGERELQREPPRRRWSFAVAGTAAVALAVAGFAIAAHRRGAPPAIAAAPPASASAPQPTAPSAKDKTPPVRRRVQIHVKPAGATLSLDGGSLPNPCDLQLAGDGQTHLLVARADGFDEQRRWLVLDRDLTLDLALERHAAASATPRARPTSRKTPEPETPAATSPAAPAAPDPDQVGQRRPRLRLQTDFPSPPVGAGHE